MQYLINDMHSLVVHRVLTIRKHLVKIAKSYMIFEKDKKTFRNFFYLIARMNQKDCNSHQYCTETTGIGSVLSNYVLSQN